jgi:hypothetical protein
MTEVAVGFVSDVVDTVVAVQKIFANSAQAQE